MFKRLLVMAVLAGFGLPVQNASANQVAPVPQSVLYHEFFFRVAWLKDQADHLLAQGLDDRVPRSIVRNGAGLTLQQEGVLEAAAMDWRQKNNALLAQLQALRTANPGPLSSALAQQLQNMQAQRAQLTLDHVNQLQAALGAAVFEQLDVFVHSFIR